MYYREGFGLQKPGWLSNDRLYSKLRLLLLLAHPCFGGFLLLLLLLL
jgi:hypothetical protein